MMIQEPEWKYMRPPPEGLWERMPEDLQRRLITNEASLRDKAKAKQQAREKQDEEIRERMRRANWVDPEKKDLRHRIYKWLDENGDRIPNTMAGITEHKAIVVEYVDRWGYQGITSYMSGCQRIYEDIEKNTQRQAEYEVEQQRWAREKEAREARAAQRAVRIEEEQRLSAESDRRQARDEVVRLEASIALDEHLSEQYKSNIHGCFHSMEVFLLRDASGNLKSNPEVTRRVNRARGSRTRLLDMIAITDDYLAALGPGWRSKMRRVRDNLVSRIRRSRERIARYEQSIEDDERQLNDLRVFLGEPEPDIVVRNVTNFATKRTIVEGLSTSSRDTTQPAPKRGDLDLTGYEWERRGGKHHPVDWRGRTIDIWVRKNGTALVRVPTSVGEDLAGREVDLGDIEVTLKMRRKDLATADLSAVQAEDLGLR